MKVLILGGGGTLGAFSAGALRALEAEGWRADACIASSAGGINLLRASAGGAAKAEQPERTEELMGAVKRLLRHG